MELIPGSETSAHLIQTPGIYPKENTLHQKHGESLKTKNLESFYVINRSKRRLNLFMHSKKIVRGSLVVRAMDPEMMRFICSILRGEAALNSIVIRRYCGNRDLSDFAFCVTELFTRTLQAFGRFTMRDMGRSNEELLTLTGNVC
jgi:hypothetical protein